MPINAKDQGAVARYRRHWFELRGDVRGQTLLIAEYDGEGAFERATDAARKIANAGYENLHVVKCYLSHVVRVVG